MAHDKTIQGIRVYLDDIINEHTELGVYSNTDTGDTTDDSAVIALSAGEGNKYHIGQRVKVTAGFASATAWYYVVAKDANSITLGEDATSTESDVTISWESEIRWAENELTGTLLTWKSGIIARNGIGATKEGADLSSGGAPAFFDGFTVMAINTNQLILRLKELSIKLPGLACEKYEFVGNEADSDATEEKKLFTGAIEDLTWDETILQIPVKNNTFKCRALMGTVINNCPAATGGNYPDASDSLNGEILPMTFGKFLPDAVNSSENLLAKFIRTSEKETILTNDLGNGVYCDPQGADIFPLIGYGDDATEAHLSYKIQFGTAVHGGAYLVDLSGKYVKVVAGGAVDGSQQGNYRKIVKQVQTTGTAASGSPIITNVPDTTDIVVGTKLYVVDYFDCAGTGNSYFDRTVISKTATTITLDFNATGSGSIDIYQGMLSIGFGGTAIFVLESFFEKDLVASAGALTANNAWVVISDIPFEFQCDLWPCKGFLDEAGTAITQEPRLYIYSDKNTARFKTKFDLVGGIYVPREEAIPEGFLAIPRYGYNIISATPYTRLLIDVKLFKNDPSKMATYSIFPCTALTKYTGADLSLFGLPDRVLITENVFSNQGSTPSTYSCVNLDKIDDRDPNTCMDVTLEGDSGANDRHDIFLAFDFLLPISDLMIEYDKYYVGLYLSSCFYPGSGLFNPIYEFRLLWRRFIGSATIINSSMIATGQNFNDWNDEDSLTNLHNMVDLPDFYYLANPTNVSNKYFYFDIGTPSHALEISGIKFFELSGINTNKNIKSISKMTLIKGNGGHMDGSNHVSFGMRVVLRELALICEKEFDLSSQLFSIFSGRAYNDTWGGRVTATDLMQDPIAFIEHACRLQNWSGVGDIKVYGKEYCPNAKIKLTGNGSFDDAGLTSIKALRPAFQIFDVAKSWTDKFKEAFCRRYFLLTRQDEDGNECIHYLDPQNTDESVPATVITMADIIGDVGETVEPKGSDVFVEPFLNYAYNSGSEKFDKQLRILNAPDAAWVGTGTEASPQYAAESGWHAEYTPGFQGTDGQDVWEDCHNLWNKFRTLESPPSDKTDAREIVLYADALHNIKEWVAWMGKRRDSFTVPYTLVPEGNGNCYGTITYKIYLTDTNFTTWPGAETDGSDITVECIGGGGGGSYQENKCGGGGGGYAKASLPYTSGTPVSVQIGTGGIGDKVGTPGTDGGDTIWNSGVLVGAGGKNGLNGGNGGYWLGGDVDCDGGHGGSGSDTNSNYGAGGGGGAGGPLGMGADGGNGEDDIGYVGGGGGGGNGGGSEGLNGYMAGGGNGGNNNSGNGHGVGGSVVPRELPTRGTDGGGGGGGALFSGANGGDGIEYDSTYGSGGGGGGGAGMIINDQAYNGGNGGLYGGGGGGITHGTLNHNPQGGNGAQGIIIITYTTGLGQPARDWFPGMKLLLNLPHRTNAFNAKYLIEKIEKDKNAGTVKVNVILLVDIPSAFFLT